MKRSNRKLLKKRNLQERPGTQQEQCSPDPLEKWPSGYLTHMKPVHRAEGQDAVGQVTGLRSSPVQVVLHIPLPSPGSVVFTSVRISPKANASPVAHQTFSKLAKVTPSLLAALSLPSHAHISVDF